MTQSGFRQRRLLGFIHADVDCSRIFSLGSARRRLYDVWLGLLIIVAVAALPTAAAADEVDIAVNAFADAGTAFGASPSPEVRDLVKAIVRCAINNTPVLICGRGEIIKRLPEDIRPLATCMAKEGAIEKCAAREALDRMPPQARDLVSCVATESNLGKCASRAAANTAHKIAIEQVDKLKADGRSELGEATPGQIRNIINVAESIRNDDWARVSFYGGAEVYKLVAKAVLRIVIPAGDVLAPVIDPVVDTVVQSRVELVVGLIEAVKKRDEPQISRLIVEFYLIANVEIPCALFNVIPGDDAREAIKEATCGTIGKAIKAIGGASSDVVQAAENVARDALDGVGIDPRGIFGEGCGAAASFYASSYAVCLKQSAFLNITNAKLAGEFTDTLDSVCRSHFEPCAKRLFQGGTSGRISQQCDPLREHFTKETAALAGGIRAMAAAYIRIHLADVLRTSPGGVCNVGNAGGLLADCARALGAQSPGLKSGNWSGCGGSNLPRPDIFEGACQIEACNAVTPKAVACLKYADFAVGTLKYALDMNCDPKVISGPRWDPDHNRHLQFCLGAPPQVSNFEYSERARISQECRIAAGMPHGISVLSVHQIASSGAFVLDGTGFQANARVVVDISGPAARMQTITNQFSDGEGKIAITLPQAAVCARLGLVTIAAREGDNLSTKPVTVDCQPCISAECRAPVAEFSVTEPRGQVSFAVKGTGFRPNVSVTISLSSSASNLPQPPLQTAGADGTFELTLQTQDVCLKPGWLSIEVAEQGKPPLQAHRVNCDAPPETPSVAQSDCSYGPATCKAGFVWRAAFPNDLVCVTPAERDVAQTQNLEAAGNFRTTALEARMLMCREGFVKRSAFEGDRVCVTPEAADRVKVDNAARAERVACRP
jgi:hypothetical protein